MNDIPTIKKQLEVRTKTVNRYEKELSYYKRELDDNKRKLGESTESPEEWSYRNKSKLIDESDKMITDTEIRLKKAIGELKDLVLQAKSKPELEGIEQLSKAEELLKKVLEKEVEGDEELPKSEKLLDKVLEKEAEGEEPGVNAL